VALHNQIALIIHLIVIYKLDFKYIRCQNILNNLSNFRGTGNKREQPFRESYGKIGHLRFFTKAPFLCMTATASLKVRSKIIKLLNMRNPKVIRQSPDKKNISYHVEKAKELDETFK